MKKRVISFLLVIAMLASMAVMPVSAAGTDPDSGRTALTEQCPCGCGLLVSEVTWKPYDANENTAPMGHYYLEGDYAQTVQRTLISGSKTVIDLRGHTLTTDGYHRLFLVEGYLAIMDTVGGGRIQSKTSGSALGGVIMIRQNETTNSTVELYSGTLTVDPDNKSSSTGGLIYVSTGSIFRMYGGVLRDGSTLSGKNGGAIAAVAESSRVYIYGGTIMNCSAATGGAIYNAVGVTELKNCRILNCSSSSGGGSVRQNGGTLTMEDCLIAGSTAGTYGGSIYSAGTTVLKNCQILGGTALANSGGNIYQAGGSLTTENCDIAFGTAGGTAGGTTGGGNIYSSGSFTDKGSTIRDGAANGTTVSSGGGNLYLSTANHVLKGTTITGGVSRRYGANVITWSNSECVMEDCYIDGDVRWGGSGLVLKGATKIGLRGNGLNLVGSDSGNVISAAGLTKGAEIFVSAYWGTFTNDSAKLEYFKPAHRTVLSKNADGTLSGNSAATDAEGGYCPHCYDPANPQKVTWQAYSATEDSTISESGHYYLSDAVTARLNIAAGTDVVIDLNGKSITSGHRCLVLKEGATLSLLDFNGAGKVTGKGGVGWPGGVIYGEKAYTLNIYGGTYIYTSVADKHVYNGGVLYAPAGSEVNIYGGTLDGSSYNQTTNDNNLGGAIALASGESKFNMTAGRIIGGTAKLGGAISFSASNTVNITGGMVTGGSAASAAGNIRAYGTSSKRGTMTLKNCAVVDGTAGTGSGGNMNNQYYSITADNCYIANGTSQSSNGGNLNHSYTSKDSYTNSIIFGGTAIRGGNICTSTTDAVATFENCLILTGVALNLEGGSSLPGSGGNLRPNNGKIVIRGGEVALGSAIRGGNAMVNAGAVSLTDHPASNDDGLYLVADPAKGIAAPVIADGYAEERGGNIYVNGIAHLTDAVISGGRAAILGQDIYFNKYTDRSAMMIGEGLLGDIRMSVNAGFLGKPIYGNPITATTATTLNASITLESYDLPVFAHDGKLFIGGTTVVDAQKQETWYVDNVSAAAACGKDQYVKLYTNNDLVLTKDLTVDFNGQSVAVSGNYKLSGMDSTGDSYALPTGASTGATNIADIAYAPNGDAYLSVQDGGSTTYHRLGMAITDVALRPDDAGLYYKAAWSGDSVVKEMIAEYGIAASLVDMPQNDFKQDPDCDSLWVGFTGAVTNGAKKCGVLVKDILKQTNQNEANDSNGKNAIYAAAYITLTNGKTIVSRDNIGYSLYDFMYQLDELIKADPTHYRRFEKKTKEFYAAWEEKGLAEWKFDRLQKPVDPTTDNEFNVLMVGSSFCSYYTQELYQLLVEAGYENVRVCNVYYSGCYVDWHYSWWKQDKANYQIYCVDEKSAAAQATDLSASHIGRTKLSDAASLEFCLAQYNWDVISLQESSGAIRATGTKKQGGTSMTIDPQLAAQQHLEVIGSKCDSLINYFHSEFPQARILWHQTWSFQIGYDRSGYVMQDAQQQARDMEMMRTFALGVCSRYDFVERVPTGEAWQVVREKYNYDGLCARLNYGTDNVGDYYHDGDIGGGQLLNACVWYEIITGQDCTKLSYVPTYAYGGEVKENRFDADMIKTAAHEAVQAMNNQ